MQQKTKKSFWLYPIFSLILAIILSSLFVRAEVNVSAQEPTPIPEEEPRIVGGDPSTPGEYPWQAAVLSGNANPVTFYYYQYCGGSVVDKYWILTAAHCVTDKEGYVNNYNLPDVLAGVYDLSNPGSQYQHKEVYKVVTHPLYNPYNFDNDIALIRIYSNSPFSFGGSVSKIALAPSDIGSLSGTESWVTGWGQIDVPADYSPLLYEVQLPIISNSQCSNFWGGIIDSNLCAGNGTGEDSCFGDSGGPLVINQSGEWIQVGIVSSGAENCGDYPGIYTRISSFRDWIDKYILVFQVNNITRNDQNPNNLSSIIFKVKFIRQLEYPSDLGVDDFSLTTTGNITGATIIGLNGNYDEYFVTVNTGSGSGTIRLNFIDDDSIGDEFGMRPGGTGTGNGNFTSGEVYNIDKTPPTVTTIECVVDPCTSNMLNVSYLVTFSENVTGVDVADFTLDTTGVAGATVSNVSGSGNTRVVNVNTGQSDGTIRLDFVDNDSVTDIVTNPTSSGYTFGEIYTIDKPELKAPILRSPRSGGAVNDTTPDFIWQRVTNAQSYEIQIDNNSDFSSLEVNNNSIILTNYTSIITLAEGTYYWRVRANDVSGNPGKWSIVRTITIDTTGPIAPTLVSPVDGFGTISRTITFRWNAVSGAVQYRLKINKDVNDFSDPDYVLTLRTLMRRITLPVGEYYWCVEAKDALGNWGSCSSAMEFGIALP